MKPTAWEWSVELAGVCRNISGYPPMQSTSKMGTLSKALGGQGGFIAGRQELIKFLRHNARGYVFSTALGPPLAAAALTGLEILKSEPIESNGYSTMPGVWPTVCARWVSVRPPLNPPLSLSYARQRRRHFD